MKLRGVKKLNARFTRFVKSIEPELTAEMGIDFDYEYCKNLVHYSLIVTKRQNDLWEKFLKESFDFDLGDKVYLMSLLHEIGHHETMEDLVELWDADELEKDVIQLLVNENPDEEKPYLDYFGLPLERAATVWAINYYLDHQNKLDKAFDKIMNNIKHFYKQNNFKG